MEKRTIFGGILVILLMATPSYGGSGLSLKALQEKVKVQDEMIKALSAKVEDLAKRKIDEEKVAELTQKTEEKAKSDDLKISDLSKKVDEAVKGKEEVSQALTTNSEEHSTLEERLGTVEEVAGKTRISGWADFTYHNDNKKNKTSKQYMDVGRLYLFADARIEKDWRVFLETEVEHLPSLEDKKGEIKFERAYFEHKGNQWNNFQFGKFNTFFGIWTPEHWMINVDNFQKPIHEDNKYVPPKQVGVRWFGKSFHGGKKDPQHLTLNYTAYLSNGSEIIDTNHPADHKLGGGADCRLAYGEKTLFGVSYYRQNNPMKTGRKEESRMVYLNYYLTRKLEFRIENFNQDRDHVKTGKSVGNLYSALKFKLTKKTYLSYRYGAGEDDKNGKGKDQVQNLLTLGHWFTPNVRSKFEFSRHEFDDPTVVDFNQFNAWLGVLF